MPTRKIRAKKYNGVYEYYRANDPDKTTISYYIGYRDDIEGKRRLVKTDATDKDEALEILNKKKAEVVKLKKEVKKDALKLNRMIMNNALTLDELAKQFFKIRTNIEAKNEEQKYKNHIKPFFKDIKLSRITVDMIADFQIYLAGKILIRNKRVADSSGKFKSTKEKIKLSTTTIKDIVDYLRVILNYAERKKLISNNPFSGDRAQQEDMKEVRSRITNQAEDTEPGRILTDEELEILWNLDDLKMNDRLYLFLKSCYFTGARPTGVIDIQVKHISFDKKTIKIKAMKKGKSYEAKVGDELLSLLKEWIRKHSLTHDNFIFYPIQSYMRAKTKAEKEACKNKSANYSGYQRRLRENIFDPVFNVGIDPYDRMYRVTVYTMRRTAGTKVYKKYGIVHAKKFLNHTDIKTTMHYLNIEDDIEVLIDAL